MERNLSDLVKLARERRHDKVLNQCGTMRLLHVSKVIETTDIYTDVYILEDRPSQQWVEVSHLVSNLNNVDESTNLSSEKFERFGLSNRQKRLPGLDVVSSNSKLMIFGKPGAGKTTFLKYLAVSSQKGVFQREYIPIFITLKDLAEDIGSYIEMQSAQSGTVNILQKYIEEELNECGVSQEETAKLLKTGMLLFLLDGLDEVPEQKDYELAKQLKDFFEKFYKNRFILTCRIASLKYRFAREKFTDVEIADFNQKQAETFISKWFSAIDKNTLDSTYKGESLIQKLKLPENETIRDLVVTPILLNLICLVFKYTSDFPSNRVELYRDGLRILLYEWDEERGTKRDELYHGLSLLSREHLLGRLAALTFEKSNYFFKQDEAQQIIADYLRTLSKQKAVDLKLDSEAVLKCIESQHGLLIERARRIYSFSHLTFHEYFAADYFLKNPSLTSLRQIVSGMLGRWREIFILTGGMINSKVHLRNLKALADGMVAEDNKIQDFLVWINQKSNSIRTTIKPEAVRSFYFGLTSGCLNLGGWPFDFALSRRIEPRLDNIIFADNIGISEADIYIDFALCFASFGQLERIKKVTLENFLGEQSELGKLISQLKTPIKEKTQLPSIENFQETVASFRRVSSLLLDIPKIRECLTHDQIHIMKSLQDIEGCQIDDIYRKQEILDIFEVVLELLNSSDCQDDKSIAKQLSSVKNNLAKYLESCRQFHQSYQDSITNTTNAADRLRNLSLNWGFNDAQKQSLWTYYHANLLLISCLRNTPDIDIDFQEEIESSLLLPFSLSVSPNSLANMFHNSSQRTQVFISYSHQDGEWLSKLQKLLKPLVRNQTVVLWDDTQIKPGAKWREEIENALKSAKVAVLLVSSDFLNSDFIVDHELPTLLEAAEKEGLVILWVYISSCLYDITEIGNYQSAHTPLRPLDSLTSAEQQKVLTEICREIQKAIES